MKLGNIMPLFNNYNHLIKNVREGILEVGHFVDMVRSTLIKKDILTNVSITGELTKLTLARSGHSYFTLTDINGSIDCVIFNGNRLFKSQNIEEGMKVIASGGIDVYVKTGRMQFKANRIESIQTIGELERIKRDLIKKWRLDGTLDIPKKPIPFIPKNMFIITGGGSAALSDMQRIIENRWPNYSYKIMPVLVQGSQAPEQIIKALEIAGNYADLIIVGRGGGSPEDLWSFNLESVCQAIIDCQVPVISAVGHESDHMVSDLVADKRASTPSNAIEITIPIKDELISIIEQTKDRFDFIIERKLKYEDESLTNLSFRLSSAPMKGIINAKIKYNNLVNLFNNLGKSLMGEENNTLAKYNFIISSTNPSKILERGYSMTIDENGKPIKSVLNVKGGDLLRVVLNDGEIKTVVK
ncbi:MAG: exodeoxyribonuclease VII large subunit [Methanobacteriota archaeon]|nr:MAG: exodeoxyribonuclease VII large subunit [Euryarchaeota archaeon]